MPDFFSIHDYKLKRMSFAKFIGVHQHNGADGKYLAEYPGCSCHISFTLLQVQPLLVNNTQRNQLGQSMSNHTDSKKCFAVLILFTLCLCGIWELKM